jgi:hypothetical protein
MELFGMQRKPTPPLRVEKIRFQIADTSGAVLQGVPATTLDID